MKRTKLFLGLGLTAVVAFALSPFGRTVKTARAQGQSRAPERSFEAKFWDYLQTVQYRNWAAPPGQGLDVHEGQSPHGAYLKTYLNRIAASDTKNLPVNSIIVKENFGGDKKTLMAITVMYRVKGFDTDHKDWYWVKYNADGTVARTPADKGSKPIAGKFKSCIDCHAGAKGGDYYFSNDK